MQGFLTSSVLGLKAKPHTAILMPLRFPKRLMILRINLSVWNVLAASTACMIPKGVPTKSVEYSNAFTSFGKQLPP